MEDEAMINELNLEMSRKLHESILKIIKVNPWRYFKSLDFIKIMMPNAKEPIYCNIVGHHIGVYSIEIYNGISEFDSYLEMHSDAFPEHQKNRFISNLFCTFGDAEKFNENRKKLIHNKKVPEIMDEIKFVKNEIGYLQRGINEAETAFLIEVFEQIVAATKKFKYKKTKIHCEDGEVFLYEYNNKKSKWDNKILQDKFIYPRPECKKLIFNDDNMINELKNIECNNEEIEMDGVYINKEVKELKPLLPKIMLYTNGDNTVKHYCTGTVKDDEKKEYYSMLRKYIKEHGKPKTICVREDRIFHFLLDMCEKLDINLKWWGELYAIDNYVDEIYDDICMNIKY